MKAQSSIAYTALAAGAILLVMVGIGATTGVSQQHFELVAPADVYARDLRAGAGPLKWIIGLDNIFIAAYSALVILLARAFYREESKYLILVFAAAGLAGGLLDYLENHHILTMLDASLAGMAPVAGEIKQRMVLSMLKWHLGYFAFFLLGLAFPARTLFAKIFRFSLLFVQLPAGVFYYILRDTAAGDLFFYARYGNLAVGFFVIAWFFYGREKSKPAGSMREKFV